MFVVIFAGITVTAHVNGTIIQRLKSVLYKYATSYQWPTHLLRLPIIIVEKCYLMGSALSMSFKLQNRNNWHNENIHIQSYIKMRKKKFRKLLCTFFFPAFVKSFYYIVFFLFHLFFFCVWIRNVNSQNCTCEWILLKICLM